jgi:predicted enzyme related to lactoylglutathione lyase
MTGRVVHFEIPTDDFDRAKEFYQSAFGWNIDKMQEMDYASAGATPTGDNGMPLEPGSINGGMFTRDDTLNRPVITIEVDDIDQSLKRIGELGGQTVQEKQEVMGMGFTAYFKDSEGNLMGLWQNA